MTKALSVSRVPGAVDSTVFFSKSSKGGTLRAAFIVYQHLLMSQAESWKGSDWSLWSNIFRKHRKFSAPFVFGWCFFIIETATFLCRFQGAPLGSDMPKSQGRILTIRVPDRRWVDVMPFPPCQPLGANFCRAAEIFSSHGLLDVANLGGPPKKRGPIFQRVLNWPWPVW